jgi:hypothetical protein
MLLRVVTYATLAIAFIVAAAPQLEFKDVDGSSSCSISKGEGKNSLQTSCTLHASQFISVEHGDLAAKLSLLDTKVDALAIKVNKLSADHEEMKEAVSNAAAVAAAAKEAAEIDPQHRGLVLPHDAPAGPVGAKFKLIANVVHPEKSMWHGGNGRSGGNNGPDYFMGLNDWATLQSSHRTNSGGPAHLFVKIFLDTGNYLLQYTNWQLHSGGNQYSHSSGVCYNGNCPSGPQMQHNDDLRTSPQGSWYDGKCCCSTYDSFGWYGGCGFGQFGFVADGGHGGKFSHPIDKHGIYQNPPVGSDSFGAGNILRKEFWLRLD